MKKLIIICILAVAAVGTYAQKLGHIDSQLLLGAMPEKDVVEKELQAYASELEGHLNGMKTQYEPKIAEVQSNPDLPQAILDAKIKEIQELEAAIQEFQVTANQDLSQKEAELLKPMIDKAQNAIDNVAKDNGFVYIFDSSTGVTVFNGGEDVLPLVKAHLGLE
jgi:outer membrane protein